MNKILSVFLLALLTGCSAPRTIFYQYTELGGIKSKSLSRLKWENEVQPGKEMAKVKVLEMDHSSTHFIQITGSEKRHVHEHHDLTIMVNSGSGLMNLGRSSFKVRPGAIIFIPRGVEHYYVSGGGEPTVGIAIYAPAYDGEDTVFKD